MVGNGLPEEWENDRINVSTGKMAVMIFALHLWSFGFRSTRYCPPSVDRLWDGQD